MALAPISENISETVWYNSLDYSLIFSTVEQPIIVRVANSSDTFYAQTITDEMEASAKARGTGIAKRSPEYVAQKMEEGKAVIALEKNGSWVGFERSRLMSQHSFGPKSHLESTVVFLVTRGSPTEL